MPPESGCERWGSLMHSLWDPVANPEPHRMVARLHVREAGYDGCGREDIVHEVADALDSMGQKRKSAYSIKRRRFAGPAADAGAFAAPDNLAVRRSLREHAINPEEWKAAAKPCALLPAAERAVQEAIRLGPNGSLQALPVHSEDVRSARQSRAGSVVAEALAKFMASKEGRQWQEDRQALFGKAD